MVPTTVAAVGDSPPVGAPRRCRKRAGGVRTSCPSSSGSITRRSPRHAGRALRPHDPVHPGRSGRPPQAAPRGEVHAAPRCHHDVLRLDEPLALHAGHADVPDPEDVVRCTARQIVSRRPRRPGPALPDDEPRILPPRSALGYSRTSATILNAPWVLALSPRRRCRAHATMTAARLARGEVERRQRHRRVQAAAVRSCRVARHRWPTERAQNLLDRAHFTSAPPAGSR